MWFKNLYLYRLPAPWTLSLSTLDEQLRRGVFTKCPSNQPLSKGWTPPRRHEDALVFSLNGQWLLTLTTEQRLLPSSVIQDEVKERAEVLTDQQGYAPGRKQMKELKERVTEELMPRAFTRRRSTAVWLDPQGGWCVIDAGSPAKADEVIEHLRDCLDDFPLKAIQTELSPMTAMGDWLASGEAPAGFTIDRDVELKADSEEKQAVRYVRHPLEGEDIEAQIKAHLAAGKRPTRLALTWDDRISFVLTEKMEIKRLAFLDLIKEEAERTAEHADEQFEADFTLMTAELARFIPELLAALGGEQASGTPTAPPLSDDGPPF